MSEAEPIADPGAAVTAEFAAALPLSEARDTAQRLLEAVATARTEKRALHIEIDGEAAHPAALQLLVAAERSAAEAGVSLQLGERAATARAALTTPASGAAQ